ncbi:MAG TPA: glycosyltransferase family 4 protein [Solirubrobacteraceae bacterium]
MEAPTAGDGEQIDDALLVPRALDGPDPRRRFSPAAMRHRLRVLFIVSQPTASPAISVHATLWRSLRPERVEVHVLYNRRAAAEPYLSSGRSVMNVLRRAPEARLIPAEFGPVGGAPRGELLAEAVRAAPATVRDLAGIARHIRRAGIDVIHAEEGSRNAFYALLLARLARVPYLVHFHSQYGDWMARLSRLGVTRADAIVAVSSWTGRGIQRAGVPSERIFPVLNGIDAAHLDPADIDGGPVRDAFGLAAGDPLVVSVAQLVHWKRQDRLIRAFRRVVDVHPSARLVLVGTEWNPPADAGADADGVTFTAQLQRLIAELGLESAVVLAGHRSDVPRLLAAADVFALPSVGDPCPLADIEAMAMGLPVVAVQDGGAPEFVQNGHTGLLSSPEDTDRLAQNLLALIDEPERRRDMGRRARDHALGYLNARRMADDVEAVYRLVCGLETEAASG